MFVRSCVWFVGCLPDEKIHEVVTASYRLKIELKVKLAWLIAVFDLNFLNPVNPALDNAFHHSLSFK